jgi:hypothetical protein
MSLASAGLLIGCTGPKAAWHSQQGMLVRDAEGYVSELKAQDKLPGIGPGDHGRLIAAAPASKDELGYPATVTVQVWKQGENSPYHYDLEKDEPQAPWRMLRATRLDESGHVIEELPLQ